MVARGGSKSSSRQAGVVTADGGKSGANRQALDRTLAALRELGRLEDIDAALIALCESTAVAVDGDPGRASLVKEYRECLVLLAGLGSSGGDDFVGLLAGLHAEVGEPPAT